MLRFESLGSDEAVTILGGLDPNARLGSWHLATGDGRVHSGGAAVPELLRRLPGGRVPAAVARSMPRTTDRIYRVVAANRGRLGRLIGVRACAADSHTVSATPRAGTEGVRESPPSARRPTRD